MSKTLVAILYNTDEDEMHPNTVNLINQIPQGWGIRVMATRHALERSRINGKASALPELEAFSYLAQVDPDVQFVFLVNTAVDICRSSIIQMSVGIGTGQVISAHDPVVQKRPGWSNKRLAVVGPVGSGFNTLAQKIKLTQAESARPTMELADHRRERANMLFSPADVVDGACMLIRTESTDELKSHGFLFNEVGFEGMNGHKLTTLLASYGHKAVVAEGTFARHLKPTGESLDARSRLYSLKNNIFSGVSLIEGVLDATTLGSNIENLQAAKSLLRLVDEAYLAVSSRDAAAQFPADLRSRFKEVIITKGSPKDQWLDALNKMPEPQDGDRRWTLVLKPWETVEVGVDIETMSTLACHPNPSVRAYEFKVQHLWETQNQVRVGPEWQSFERRFFRRGEHDSHILGESGGQYHGYCPEVSPDGTRVANIRILSSRFKTASKRDAARALLLKEDKGLAPPVIPSQMHEHLSDENAVTIPLQSRPGIGLHMLFHQAEDPNNIARWMDELYGVLDASMLVWTGNAQVPNQLISRLTRFARSTFLKHPLNDHFASARNVGIEELFSQPKGGRLGWALFFDPDEWLMDPLEDSRTLVNMAGGSGSWGYLFQVLNHTPDGPHISESIRMSRLDSLGVMRMSGRVHESFSPVLQTLQAAGISPNIQKAPFLIGHSGMGIPRGKMEAKLQKYKRLLELEVEESPLNAGAWTALAAQLRHEGSLLGALECLERADSIAGDNSIFIRRELAAWHIAQAYAYHLESVRGVSQSHSGRSVAKAAMDKLRGMLPPAYPHLGVSAPTGAAPNPTDE